MAASGVCQFCRLKFIIPTSGTLKMPVRHFRKKSKIIAREDLQLTKNKRMLKGTEEISGLVDPSCLLEGSLHIERMGREAELKMGAPHLDIVAEQADRHRRMMRTIGKKFFSDPPEIQLLTSRGQLHLRKLNETLPEFWTPRQLSLNFPASVKQVIQILKQKRKFSDEEVVIHDGRVLQVWRDLRTCHQQRRNPHLAKAVTADSLRTFQQLAQRRRFKLLVTADGVDQLQLDELEVAGRPVDRAANSGKDGPLDGHFSRMVSHHLTDLRLLQRKDAAAMSELKNSQRQQIGDLLSYFRKVIGWRNCQDVVQRVVKVGTRFDLTFQSLQTENCLLGDGDDDGERRARRSLDSLRKSTRYASSPSASASAIPAPVVDVAGEDRNVLAVQVGDCFYDSTDGEFLYRLPPRSTDEAEKRN